ncbi:unnamed protein product [Choristocarpus tenellus]
MGARRVAAGAVAALVVVKVSAIGWERVQNSRLTLNIKRALVSPELDDSLKSIKDVVTAFERDVRSEARGNDRFPALVNLLVLNTIHERGAAARDADAIQSQQELEHDGRAKKIQRRRSQCISGWKEEQKYRVDEKIGKEAARYVRFAISAYGVLMLKGANVMSWDVGLPPVHKLSMNELNHWCISRHSGITEEDLIKANYGEQRDLHIPGYFIAVDKTTSSIVLSIRGTFSMKDIITDLVCDSADFLGGKGHRGLCQSAAMLLTDVKDDLLEQLKQHKGFRLVICGHSLGAGVGILLTMMLLEQRQKIGLGQTIIKCFAFAPPPVFTPLTGAPHGTADAVHAFVLRNDMVCRLSLASAYKLFCDLKEIDSENASLPQRVRYLARERRPHIGVQDDGNGLIGMNVDYRYATILKRSTKRAWNIKSRGQQTKVESGEGSASTNNGCIGEVDSSNPVEDFVNRKVGRDFMGGGVQEGGRSRHADGVGRGDVGDLNGSTPKYDELKIPGQIYRMSKCIVEQPSEGKDSMSGVGRRGSMAYWIERAREDEFERLLFVDTAIMDHLPKGYEEALHALFGDGLTSDQS